MNIRLPAFSRRLVWTGCIVCIALIALFFLVLPNMKSQDEYLAALPDSSGLHLHDGWDNVTSFPLSSYTVECDLERSGDAFVGQVRYVVHLYNDYNSDEIKRTVPVSIPAARVRSILTGLQATTVTPDHYVTPTTIQTEEFPDIRLEIDTAQGKIQFFTKTVNKDTWSWGVQTGWQEYVTTSSTIQQAYFQLSTELHTGETIAAIQKEWEQKQKPQYTIDSTPHP